MKMKEIGPRGGALPWPPLDPLMVPSDDSSPLTFTICPMQLMLSSAVDPGEARLRGEGGQSILWQIIL